MAVKWSTSRVPTEKPANEIKIGSDIIFRFDLDSGWEISRLNYLGNMDELTIVVSKRKPGDIKRRTNAERRDE